MLLYKDGRLYAGRSSFALVNGCKVNDNPPAWYRNGITLNTEDETCMIDINFEHGNGGAQKSLEESRITEELDKLAGFDAPTGLKDSEGSDVNIFRMIVTAPHGSDIKTIRKHPEIAGILNSFQP